MEPEEEEYFLPSAIKPRHFGTTVYFNTITEKELRALYNQRSALNETKTLTNHMKKILWDSTKSLPMATENSFKESTAASAKPDRLIMVPLFPKMHKGV